MPHEEEILKNRTKRGGCRGGRWSGALIALAIIGASCGDGAGDPVEAGATTPPSSSPSSTSPSSATEAPTTSSAPTSTSNPTTTSTPPTSSITTTSVAPPAPVEGPVFVIVDGDVLGWWEAGEWVDPDPDGVVAPPVLGVEFRFPAARLGTLTLAEVPNPGCFPESGWTTWYTSVRDGILVSGDHPLRPQPVDEVPAAAVHMEAVRSVLDDGGVAADVPVEIDRVLRFDLEGDGVDEVLIEANKIPEGSIWGLGPGHYSVVLYRRVTADGSVENIVIHSDLDPPGQVADSLTEVRIRGLLDLNGDGVLELVTSYRGYEWGGHEIRSLQREPAVVISVGCGV